LNFGIKPGRFWRLPGKEELKPNSVRKSHPVVARQGAVPKMLYAAAAFRKGAARRIGYGTIGATLDFGIVRYGAARAALSPSQ
jgi:hypothetical protein